MASKVAVLVASLELLLQQMEIAARATYIMMKDLETLTRMMTRLNGEIEHLRFVAEIMWLRLRSSSQRRREILKEYFVGEDDGAIVEQMNELQQHINLCFLSINRSRRLVFNENVGVGD